jgi:hypothetical protein
MGKGAELSELGDSLKTEEPSHPRTCALRIGQGTCIIGNVSKANQVAPALSARPRWRLIAPASHQQVVDLPEEPKMRKAKLIGYALTK